jgi:hypothetical protein
MIDDRGGDPDGAHRALRVTFVLLRRAAAVGFILFVLPPTGAFPYRWQAVVAFPILVSWCYAYGVFARRDVQMAALEAIPTLWLSLRCTEVMVHLVELGS